MTAVMPEGIALATKLMEKGWLNRYQPDLIEGDDEEAHMTYLLQCENALAKYIGVKYCIGLNSGASAIFLALKCGGLPKGGKVLTNAFTFNAVPASIVHADGEPVLVECDNKFVIDLEDLEKKINETGAHYLVLSYMRGRIPDMDAVMALVQKYDLYLVEDSAHAYACEWKGKKIGAFGRSSTMSTQANKLMNSGEGGFLLTNEDTVIGQAICCAGSYEEYMLKHKEMCPPMELMVKYRLECINYSMRMTNLQGAILLPQVAVLDERREALNASYYKLVAKLETHDKLTVPPQYDEVTPVYDSLQFNINDATLEQIDAVIKYCKTHFKVKLARFGATSNARNWKTWQFVPNIEDNHLPNTDKFIGSALDIRLDAMSDEKIDHMVSSIHKGLDAVFSEGTKAMNDADKANAQGITA